MGLQNSNEHDLRITYVSLYPQIEKDERRFTCYGLLPGTRTVALRAGPSGLLPVKLEPTTASSPMTSTRVPCHPPANT